MPGLASLLHYSTDSSRPPRARGAARRSRPVPSLGGLLWAVPRAAAPAHPFVGGPLPGPSCRLARRNRRRANW
eukprot:15435072-Alexandrium_andersonii.AAC.1